MRWQSLLDSCQAIKLGSDSNFNQVSSRSNADRNSSLALIAWCEGGDSNPHGLPRQLLRLVRLPIPLLSRAAAAVAKRTSIVEAVRCRHRWRPLSVARRM